MSPDPPLSLTLHKTKKLLIKLCILPFKNKCVDPVKINV